MSLSNRLPRRRHCLAQPWGRTLQLCAVDSPLRIACPDSIWFLLCVTRAITSAINRGDRNSPNRAALVTCHRITQVRRGSLRAVVTPS